MDKLRAMQTFVRIVEGGSLTAAAESMRVSLPSSRSSNRRHAATATSNGPCVRFPWASSDSEKRDERKSVSWKMRGSSPST